VKVCAVLPGSIDTPFFRHAANYTGRRAVAMPPVYSPERVATAIVNAVRFPRRDIVVGPASRLLVTQSKWTPGVVEKVTAFHVDRALLPRKHSAPPTHGNLHDPASGTGDTHGEWNGRRRTAVRRITSALVLAGTA
jgi:hypothetical protein